MLFQHAWKHHSWYPHEVVASLPEGHSLLRVCLAWAQCRWHPNFPSRFGKSHQKLPGRGPSCKFKRNFGGLHPEATSRVSGRFVTDRISTTNTPGATKNVLCPPVVLLCGATKKRQNQINNRQKKWMILDLKNGHKEIHFEAVGRLWNSSLMSCPPKSQNQVFLFTIPF